MKIAASYLSIKDDLGNKIKALDNTTIDYIHVDVMDGEFVSNKTVSFDILSKILSTTKKPKDVHLMVSDIKKYIDMYASLNPEYITFHLEATQFIEETINYIREKGIKVGISIKPNTSLELLMPYLGKVDLVLIMSVEPGLGGQKFIPETCNRVDKLKQYCNDLKLNCIVEIDGGINDKTINMTNADMCVVGSFITNSDNYQEQINRLKEDI